MKQIVLSICLLMQVCSTVFAQYNREPIKLDPKLSLTGGAELVLPVQGGGIYGSLLYHITHRFGVNVNASYDWYTPSYENKQIATFSLGARLGLSHILFSQFDMGYSYAHHVISSYAYDPDFRALHFGLNVGVHLENNFELSSEMAYGVFPNSNIPNLFFKLKVGFSLAIINRMVHASP